MKITRVNRLGGEITVPGDKSISHRAIMLGSISKGTTEIHNFLEGADCLSTIDCFKRMGIQIEKKEDKILVYGNGLVGLKEPSCILDCGNSGTTIRLLSGILSATNFTATITGDESIQKRPMKRIMEPLSNMGAKINSVNENGCAPLEILGTSLKGRHYESKVASAQVKSAILFAGLYADDETSVTEPYLSRNHSEIMLDYFGATIKQDNTTTIIQPAKELYGQKVMVPGDISSAAYFIAAALLVPNSEILIKNVGINPTRAGILKVCQQMGADISLLNVNKAKGEDYADILIKHSPLNATVIEGDMIPTLIDELPIIAVLACFANGTTIIKDAQELKVKESNRIDIMVNYLSAMGANIRATEDGMIIEGGTSLKGTTINSMGDHRIAMSFAIAGLLADGETTILNSDCIKISYPNFNETLEELNC
ncbi:MAG: 3-phosphoshikimate 1-carboxyvinyltransferase [Clostridiales bacterium]|nr:3-phosphoshikimate 1-carboxyvinyltransferase [Clostridiales bacterium]